MILESCVCTVSVSEDACISRFEGGSEVRNRRTRELQYTQPGNRGGNCSCVKQSYKSHSALFFVFFVCVCVCERERERERERETERERESA